MRTWVVGMVLVALMGCQTTTEKQATSGKEEPVQAALKPILEPPEILVGDTLIWLENGQKELRNEVTALDDRQLTVAGDNGCTFSVPITGFGPSYFYKNCGGYSGTQEVEPVSESPYPISVGKSWNYVYSGIWEGEPWKDTRKCSVDGTARVTVPLGDFDTFKLVCNDRWTRRTWYVAPEVGRSVKYERYHKRRHTTRTLELIRVDKAPVS